MLTRLPLSVARGVLAAALLVPAGFLFASHEGARSFSQINGHGWRMLAPEARHSYVDGVNDALTAVMGRTRGTACEVQGANLFRDYATPGLTAPEVGRFLSEFYQDPANRPIAVVDALEILVARLRNVPEAAIQDRIQQHRKIAATAPEQQ